MHPYLAKNIHFCPKCGSDLTISNHVATCGGCGFEYYLNPAPCSSVIFYQNNQILLAKRSIEPRKGYWDVVGGFIEVGESAEAAAIREVKEETNLDVKVTNYLGSIADIYGDTLVPTLIFLFEVEITGGEPKPLDDVGELKWFDLNDLPTEYAFSSVEKFIDLFKKSRL